MAKADTTENFTVARTGLIETHPADTLTAVKSSLALLASIDWDSPMPGASDGAQIVICEAMAALEHVINQTLEVSLDQFANEVKS